MRRREASAKELAKIVSLRQNNFSWLTIEKETGVPRRIAQRAYRDWERTQEGDEFKAARQTVAAEELRKHLDSLKKLAFVLVRDFDIPRPSRDPQSAKEFLKSLLEQDIASDYGAYGLPGLKRDMYLVSTTPSYSSGVYYRQNQMLLKSLQDHTDQKLNLSKWESAYDACRTDQAKLLKELDQILPIVLNLNSKLAEAIASKEKKITGQIADGLVFLLWESILAEAKAIKEAEEAMKKAEEAKERAKKEAEEARIAKGAGKVELKKLVSKIKVLGGGEHRVELAFGNLASPTVIVPDDVGTQAKEVCIGVIKNLLARREELIDPLLEDVKKMKRENDGLAKVLNPLTLVPDILHSKCDLCPC